MDSLDIEQQEKPKPNFVFSSDNNCVLRTDGLSKIKDVVNLMDQIDKKTDTKNPIVPVTNSLSAIIRECAKRYMHVTLEHKVMKKMHDDILGTCCNLLLPFLKSFDVTIKDALLVSGNVEMALKILTDIYQDYDRICINEDICLPYWFTAAESLRVFDIIEYDKAIEGLKNDYIYYIDGGPDEYNVWNEEEKDQEHVGHYDFNEGGLIHLIEGHAPSCLKNVQTVSLPIGKLLGFPHMYVLISLSRVFSKNNESPYLAHYTGPSSFDIASCYYGLSHLGMNGILSSYMLRCKLAHDLQCELFTMTTKSPFAEDHNSITIKPQSDPRMFAHDGKIDVTDLSTVTLPTNVKGPLMIIHVNHMNMFDRKRWKLIDQNVLEVSGALYFSAPFLETAQEQRQWVEKIAKEVCYNMNHTLYLQRCLSQSL